MKKNNEKKTVEKDVDLSRRRFLRGGVGALVVGGAIAGGFGASILKPGIAQATLPGYLPRPTNLLDINLVKKHAFNYYFSAGG